MLLMCFPATTAFSKEKEVSVSEKSDQSKKRIKILLTNDDGISAKGMTLLVSNLLKADFADIYIVAPATEQSAKSMAFTCRESVVLQPYDYPQPVAGAWSVSGTPVDCVKIALSYLFKDALPDLVLSGINSGSNAGRHVFYSGTTGAAMEAILYGIPAIGLSQEKRICSFQENNPNVPEILKSLSLYALSRPFGSHPVVLNVNFPANSKPWKGMRFVSGGEEYSCGVPKLLLCNGDSKIFALTNCPVVIGEVPSEEYQAMLDNYISVAPLVVRSSPVATLSLKEFEQLQSGFHNFANTIAMRK
ncbi:5'/3'-nucleotidase SurE [Chlamydia sp. 04-14]|uniref:5'/3'-nucleotidase SurE n=1 Tax=Chlamydia TaxID=810 RepID=UPI002FCA21E6